MENQNNAAKTTNLVKGFLIGLNSLTFIGGLSLMVIGIASLFMDNVIKYSVAIPWWTIAISFVVLVVSFHGVYGTYMENKVLLNIYFVVVTVIIIAQLVLVIMGLVNQNSLGDNLDSSWQKAYEKDPNVIKEVQNTFECCGFNDPKDRSYPIDSKGKGSCLSEYGFHKSCRYSLTRSYHNSQVLLLIGGIVVMVVQIVAMVFSGVLLKLIKNAEAKRSNRGESEALLSEQSAI